MARLVHLRHPKTGGECHVPESTALALSASGWIPAERAVETPSLSDTHPRFVSSQPPTPTPTDLETEVSDPESEED